MSWKGASRILSEVFCHDYKLNERESAPRGNSRRSLLGEYHAIPSILGDACPFRLCRAAFYALSPPRVRMIDVDAEMASRGIDRAHYKFGPSMADAIHALGGDAENAIEPDVDPELIPYFFK